MQKISYFLTTHVAKKNKITKSILPQMELEQTSIIRYLIIPIKEGIILMNLLVVKIPLTQSG